MYSPNLNNITDNIAKDIYTAILANKTIQKHTLPYSWISGSSMEVFPINLCLNSVEVQMDSGNRNYYIKAIQKVVENNPQLFKKGYFCKSDGSCPSYIRFAYSDDLMKRIEKKMNCKINFY